MSAPETTSRVRSAPPLRPAAVRVPILSLTRFEQVVEPDAYARQLEAVRGAASRLEGRVFWQINSTARGGGVAEMMWPLVGYERGAGIDARWMVIAGTPEFFRITKRLHNFLHGDPGDGGELGAAERRVYDEVLRANAAELQALVRPGDVVMLHDPQTAGLVPVLRRGGAAVVWRSHIGQEELDSPLVRRGWEFLQEDLLAAHATVFSRTAYVPGCCDTGRSRVIRPSIDPFSPKNEDLSQRAVRNILVHVGLLEGPDGTAPVFHHDDGSPGRVDRGVDIIRVGRAPEWETPLVVQISRWDRLKDPVGVMEGFARLEPGETGDAQLVVAGPAVTGVDDDPEGPAVLAEVTEAWRALPHERRRRIQIAALPMVDAHENAAIVNALQRHATIVVQKSVMEGFGLTVTEAMWKARPVVASAVGGIQDQIDDGVDGILIERPDDLDGFANALRRLLADPSEARRMGDAARERVRREFLGMRLLADEMELVEGLVS